MGVPDPEAKGADAPTASDTAPGILLDNNAVEAEYGSTQRGLSPRHVQLIAIGGAIGTGLFVGIGGTLAKAGPLSLILGYLSWGVFFVWPTNLCVAEMCSYLPISGGIFELAARYVDPALGFAMGWTYFYTGVMLLCVEYSAIATLMQYWVDDVNPAVWIVMGMVICISLNVVAVKWYGESEFIMASLKILLLIGLLMLTLITMCGGNPKKDAYGFRYWGNHKAMLSYYTDGATGRLLGWWKVVIYAAFTITGPDILALSAGEIQNPRRTIPRVAKLVFYRLVGFYVLGVLGVGIICSGQDPTLKDALENGAPGAAASPWVIGIQNLGISGLPHLINFLILTSGMSCGNAYLYASSRTLYGLARDGQAPRFLMKCTKAGVPIYCVCIISVLSCITFLVSSTNALKVFYWFVDLTTTGFIATYTMMLWTFVGWYRARVKQGLNVASLHYTAPFAPYSAYLAIGLGILALIFCGFDTIHPFKVQGFITNYFCIPYSIGFFILWKVVKGTKFVDPETADIISGKKEVDEECREWEEGGIEENWRAKLAEMPFWQRVWERMW